MNTPQTVVEQQTVQKTRVGRSILLGLSVSAAAFIFFGFNAVMLLGGNEGGGEGGGAVVPMYASRVIAGGYIGGGYRMPNVTISAFLEDYGLVDQRSIQLGHIPAGTGLLQPDGELTRDGRIVVGVDASHTAMVLSLHLQNSVNDTYRSICIPAQTIPPYALPMYYVVDSVGNTYVDGHFRTKINPGECWATIEKALKAGFVSSAVASSPYTGLDTTTTLKFTRDRQHYMGAYNFAANSYLFEPIQPRSPDDRATTPLAVELARSGDLAPVTIPARAMTITYTTGAIGPIQKTLCIPQTQVGGAGTLPNGEPASRILYYFDKYGNPYTDSLLTQLVACTVFAPSPMQRSQIAP